MDTLLDEDLTAFLESRPGWIALTTLDPDGLPHTVPLGYVPLEGRIYLGCRDGTRKVRNIERDPRVSLMLATARGAGVQRGIMIQGSAAVIRDPERFLAIQQAAARLWNKPVSRAPRPGAAFVEVTPRRVRRWTVGGA